MPSATKQVRTETAHRLKDHPGACRNLHGHSYLWEITLTSHRLNDAGMVVDFSDVKKLAAEHIVNVYDHATVLQDSDPLLPCLPKKDLKIVICSHPPTAEHFAMDAAIQLSKLMPDDTHVAVRVWETNTSYAEAHAYLGTIIG